TDVPDHRMNRFEIVIRKFFTARLPAKQDQSGDFPANDHWQHEFDSFSRELLSISTKKRIRIRHITDERIRNLAGEKRLHLNFVDINSIHELIAESPDRNTTQWARTTTFDNRAAPQSERAQQQVHRRAHHLVEVTGAGNLLS